MSSGRLLALVVAIVAVVVVAALAAGGRDDEPARAGAGGQVPQARELPPEEPTGGAAAPAAAAGSALRATLVAGGRAYLPLPDGGLRGAIGEQAQGDALTVLGITKQGFVAGAGELQRVYVLWPQDPPAVQTQVDLTGVVVAAPEDPRTGLGLSAADALLVERAGAYIRADEVRATG